MIGLRKIESASLIRERFLITDGISDIFPIIDLIPSINLRNCFCNCFVFVWIWVFIWNKK